MLFKIEDKSVPKDVDFLKEFGTLYDLLIYLLNNSIRMTTSAKDQIMFLEAINTLKTIISSMKTDIKDQSEEEKKKIFAKQENVLGNAEILLMKIGELIEQFLKKNIISKDEKFYDAPKKLKKAYQKNQNKNLINQFLNGRKCQKIDLIS